MYLKKLFIVCFHIFNSILFTIPFFGGGSQLRICFARVCAVFDCLNLDEAVAFLKEVFMIANLILQIEGIAQERQDGNSYIPKQSLFSRWEKEGDSWGIVKSNGGGAGEEQKMLIYTGLHNPFLAWAIWNQFQAKSSQALHPKRQPVTLNLHRD